MIMPGDWDKNNCDVYKKAALEYNERLETEMEEMDKEMEALGLEIPNKIARKLAKKYKLSLNKTEKHYLIGPKVASILIGFFLMAGIVIGHPQIVTAVVNVIREIFVVSDGRSAEISLADTKDVGLYLSIPEDFNLDAAEKNENISRNRYVCLDSYIEVTVYPSSYKLILDDEQYDAFDSVTCGVYVGKIHSKNGITTIAIDFDGSLVEIESNLPMEEIKQIADSIKAKE